MPRKVLIALPPAMLEQVDMIAGHEHRTRSDLIRESLRRYIAESRKNNYPQIVASQPVPSHMDEVANVAG